MSDSAADYVKGAATVSGQGTVAVDSGKGKSTLKAKAIVIAAGSDHVHLPGAAIDEKHIVSSTGALSLDQVPKHLVVIGGGAVGPGLAPG